MTDDNSGFTTYNDRVQRDYWGNYTSYGLKRNLQEISSPLNDPQPIPIYRGPDYEQTTACQFEITPLYIGKTTRPFPQNSAYTQAFDLDPSIPNMEIGCTFRVN